MEKEVMFDNERVNYLLSTIGISTYEHGKERDFYERFEDLVGMWSILSVGFKEDMLTAMGLL